MSRSLVDPWERFLDAAVGAVVLLHVSSMVHGDATDRGTAAVLVAAVTTLLRYRSPRACLFVSLAISLVAPWLQDERVAVWAMTQVCLGSFVVRTSRHEAIVAAVVVGATMYGTAIALAGDVLDPGPLSVIPWTAAVAGGGLAVRAQRQYVASLERQAILATKDREADFHRRLTEERLRIARDLHDAVAHQIALINVHAGSARSNLRTATDVAERSLIEIGGACRSVLREMQQILFVLRGSDGRTGDREPRAVLDLPALLGSFRAIGLEVTTEITGDLDALDPAVKVTLQRVLQEALTNAQRHSDGRARLTVASAPGHVLVEVLTPGQRGGADGRASRGESGFGLIGMRERVTAAGGSLVAEQTPSGFLVRASFDGTDTTR